ncbi:hypothetical protein A5707_05440 [Mycobacterium kyorinense]|uniref:Mce protein n=1 Tax=Mycobacterium kyorinense TaxID=487514 RepID=A0A1A2YYS4_9MYCO|nr:hypothetical protein [Mycobacterium kyorinense]OBI43175.1 hypothetical protein A5707_05440 [Mycobacterium kyorinense]
MPSRQRPPEELDGEPGDAPGGVTDSNPISVAEAEDAAAQAEARAKEARARATRLRQAADTAPSDESDIAETAGDGDAEQPAAEPVGSRLRWLRRPERKTVAVAAGIVLFCASIAASGYMVWQDRTIMHKRQLVPEFAAAARQGVTTFMSIDPRHAKEDVQHIIDACTGELKAEVEARSAFMVQQAEETKVTSRATVEGVGVESVTGNSGVALVAAKTDVTNADNTKRPPMLWRLSVTIERDAGQLKMSKVDFLQ